jgi:hypothetical protein
MPFVACVLADVAPPDTSFEVTMLACAAAPFLFGFAVLAAAHIHRKRAQRSSENARDDT